MTVTDEQGLTWDGAAQATTRRSLPSSGPNSARTPQQQRIGVAPANNSSSACKDACGGSGPYGITLTMFEAAMIQILIDLLKRTKIGGQLLGFKEAPLVERAQEVSDALMRAGALVEELQAEVLARSAIIESLFSQTRQAEERAEAAKLRAGLTEEESKAIDNYLDRALINRFAELEKSARKREWSLGTIVALVIGLVVGVGSILIVHFLFGF